MVIPERREMNEMNPKTDLADCLERASRHRARGGNPVRAGNHPELRRWCQECREAKETKVHRVEYWIEECSTEREFQRSVEDASQVINGVLINVCG